MIADVLIQGNWSRGLPVVIADMLIQGNWDPEYFINTFDEDWATVVNCETGKTEKMRVREYFERFLNSDGRKGIWKLKVVSSRIFLFGLLDHHRTSCFCRIGRPRKISGTCFQHYLRLSATVYHAQTWLGLTAH